VGEMKDRPKERQEDPGANRPCHVQARFIPQPASTLCLLPRTGRSARTIAPPIVDLANKIPPAALLSRTVTTALSSGSRGLSSIASLSPPREIRWLLDEAAGSRGCERSYV